MSMAQQLIHLYVIIAATFFQLLTCVSNGFLFFSLYIIYLGNVIGNYGFIILFILNNFKTLQSLIVVLIPESKEPVVIIGVKVVWICLLYTSDAADERSSVDLGGR